MLAKGDISTAYTLIKEITKFNSLSASLVGDDVTFNYWKRQNIFDFLTTWLLDCGLLCLTSSDEPEWIKTICTTKDVYPYLCQYGKLSRFQEMINKKEKWYAKGVR